jgi:hypothetical protein
LHVILENRFDGVRNACTTHGKDRRITFHNHIPCGSDQCSEITRLPPFWSRPTADVAF